MADAYSCVWIGNWCLIYTHIVLVIVGLVTALLFCVCCQSKRSSKRGKFPRRKAVRRGSSTLKAWAWAKVMEMWSVYSLAEIKEFYTKVIRARFVKELKKTEKRSTRKQKRGRAKQSMTSPTAKTPTSPLSPNEHNDFNNHVVGAAEKAILRVADERDQVQKKTFTKWINKHLAKINRQVDNLYEDLRDGHNLIALLEVLSGITLPREKGRLRFHRLHNVQIALDFLRQRKLRLVNIRSDDITDGNPKLTLGLIWTIILHFQIEDISVEGWEDVSAKQALLIWARRNMEGYDGVEVKNFTTSWRDGRALNVILHRNKPDVLDIEKVMDNDNKVNLEQAFHIAEKEFGVTRLLDPDDVDVDRPDERSIITYISSLYDTFPQVPEFPIKITEKDWMFTWEEYRLLITTLTDWIQTQTCIMRRRDDIDSVETPTEVQDLIDELKRFENDDLPPKEVDVKSLIPKHLSVEQLSLESKGKYKVPEGYEPTKALNLFQELLQSISDRDEYLVDVYNRLKTLHEMCMKITRSASECHKKLDHAEHLIKEISESSDDVTDDADQVRKLLEACEADIKENFNDVQKVKDANYYQAEEMYKLVFVLHERWISARTEFNLALKNAECNRLEAIRRMKTKLEETREYIRLINCIKQIDGLKSELDQHVWGNDEPGVQGKIEEFEQLSQAVDKMQAPVSQCHNDKDKFDEEPEDQAAYCVLLTTLNSKHDQLKDQRSAHDSYFRELLEFVKEATAHLVFLHEKEDLIVGQNIVDGKAGDIDQQYMNLMGDVEAQESSFAATTRKGEHLLEKSHPASGVVKSYLEAMRDQWRLILNLSMCLEEHISDLMQHQQFSNKCSDTESWLDDFDQKLNDVRQTLERGNPQEQERCLHDNKNLAGDLETHRPVVKDIVEQSYSAPCIRERSSADSDFPLKALCSYRGDKLAIAKSEECRLLARNSEHYVTVSTASDQQGKAPVVIFQYAPPSDANIERAGDIQERFNRLLVEYKACNEKLYISTLAHRINSNCTSVLSWTIEDYRNMNTDEKSEILLSLSREITELDNLSEGHDDQSGVVQSCHIKFKLCQDHVEKLLKDLGAENEAEHQCQTYVSRLNVLLRRIVDLHGTVVVRIKESPIDNRKEVPRILKEHEVSVEELERCQPHYEQVCSDADSVADRYSGYPCSEKLRSQIERVRDGWDSTWSVTHIYLNKLKVIMLLGDDIDQTENVLEKTERFLSEFQLKVGYAELKEQQEQCKEFQNEMEKVEPALASMNENERSLKNLVDDLQTADSKPNLNEEIAIHSPVRSTDLAVYSQTVENINQRWQVCKVAITENLERIGEVLPRAQKAASDDQKTAGLVGRLHDLLEKIKELEKTQNDQNLRDMHSKEIDLLKQLLNSQQAHCHKSDEIKPEYDELQAEVVNFVNDEASGDTTALRDLFKVVQEKWNVIWVLVHAHMEKLKGVVHVQQSRDQCEQIVDEFEKALMECEGKMENIAEVDAALQRLQNLVAMAQKYDANFDVMNKNLASTQEVAAQLPESWRSNDDVGRFASEVEELNRRWENAKKDLDRRCAELNEQILEMKKANAAANDLNELYVRVAAFNNELKVISETQNSKISMPLSHEPASLEKCLAQQVAAMEKVHLLSANYYTLSAECSEYRNETKDRSNEVVAVAYDKLCVEEDTMHQLWLALNDKAELFKNKLICLISAVKNLGKFSRTTETYEEALGNLTESDGIDKLKQHKQLLTDLSRNIPENDENDDFCRKSVGELTSAGSDLNGTCETVVDGEEEPDADSSKCSDDFLDVHERWLKVKLQLERQISSCVDAIREKEKDMETEELLRSLLEELKSLLDEVKKIESSQTVRADIMLPSDPVALDKTFQQQKSLQAFLSETLTPRYVDVASRCDDALTNTPHTSSAPALQHHLETLKSNWALVSELVEKYLNKLCCIEYLVACLSKAQPLVKTYSGRIADAKVNTDSFVEPEVLQGACDKLEKILADAEADRPRINDVRSAMAKCKEEIEKPSDDQDLQFYDTVCEKLYEDWEAIFKNLNLALAALRKALPEAEKVLAVNQNAEDFLEKLEKLQSELDGIQYTVQAWIALTLPSEMEPIQKAIEQHRAGISHTDDVSNRFDAIESQSEPLLETSTPTTDKLKTVLHKLKNQIASVKGLNDIYTKKLESTCMIMKSVNTARVPLCHYEKQLLIHDTMPANVAQLQAQKEIFEELDAEAPSHDPKFEDLSSTCESYVTCLNSIQPDDDTSTRIYFEITNSLNERWRVAKEQVKERLIFLNRGGEKLDEIETRTKGHVEWLDQNEPSILEAVNHSLKSSKEIKTKLNEQEVIENDLKCQCKDMDQINHLVSQFDDAARGYDQVALSYDPPLPDGVEGKKFSPEEMDERSGKRKTIIEYEVITITRKYDKLKNLLSEKVDHYKVDFKKAKDREEKLLRDYNTSAERIDGWLDHKEKKVDEIVALPIPLEPKALQEQVRLVEELGKEIQEGKKLLVDFDEASENLQDCPKYVYQHLEKEKPLSQTKEETDQRYNDLAAKSNALSGKLNSTLEQSEDVSVQLDDLQKQLKDIGAKIAESKSNCVATSSEVKENIALLKDLNGKTDVLGVKVEELQKKCVSLFGSANLEAGCSLKNTMANLVALHSSVGHEGQQWHKHLNEICSDLETFESSQRDVVSLLDDAQGKIQQLVGGDKGYAVDGLDSSGDLQHGIELTREKMKKLQEIRSELQGKEPSYTETLSNGEKLLVSCCFETSPLVAKIDELKSKWKEIFSTLKLREDELLGSSNELAKNQDAITRVKTWVCDCGSDYVAFKDTVQKDPIASYLDKMEVHTSSAEPIRCDPRCQKYLQTSFDLSSKADDSGPERCFTFAGLLNDLGEKRNALEDILESLKKIDSMSKMFGDFLTCKEKEKSDWSSKLAEIDLERLRSDTEAFENWKAEVSSHSDELKSLQEVVGSFLKRNDNAEGIDDVASEFDKLEKRWKNLLADCDDFHRLLVGKCDAEQHFRDKTERLAEWLQDKRTIHSMLDVPSSDLGAFDKQSKQIEKLGDDVASHESVIDDAAAYVEILPELSSKHEEVKGDWKDLGDALSALLEKRKVSSEKIKSMQDLLNGLVAWSKDTKEKLDKTRLTADVPLLEDELDKMKKLRRDEVEQKKADLSECQTLAEDLAKSEVISETVAGDVTAKATDAFDRATQSIDNHEKKVAEMLNSLKSTQQTCQYIATWCKATSLDLKTTDNAPMSVEETEASLQKLEKLASTGEKHGYALKGVEESLAKLSEESDEGDAQFVKDTKEKLASVLEEIEELAAKLKARKRELDNFHELSATTDQKLDAIKNRMDMIQEMSGLTAKQIKHCQEIHRDLSEEGHSVLAVCDSAKCLTDAAGPVCQHAANDDNQLTEAANRLAEKYQDLKLVLAELGSNFESLAKFEAEMSDVYDKLNQFETGLDEFEPVGRTEPTLVAQEEESSQLFASFSALNDEVADLRKRFDEYAAAIPGTTNHERDIKIMSRNAKRLLEKCARRKSLVSETLRKLNEFQSESRELEEDLTRMIDELKAKDFKNAEPAQLKLLQGELKAFRQESINPARRRTNEVTGCGYALIYSADPSVTTSHLLERVKHIEQLWAQLSAQATDLDSELHNTLISSGHYKDAYNSFLIWLKNVELLVARQQPLSWEYTVVAVQFEEHKAQAEILSKEHEVLQSLLRQFEEYRSTPEDRSKIQDLQRRWDAAWKKITKRSDELSVVYAEARIFHGISSRFQTWLGRIEKRSMDLVFTGTVQDRIDKEIQYQEALLKEIAQHESAISEIESTPLKKLFQDCDEQHESLGSHLVVLRSRFEEAKRAVECRHGVLLNNRKLAHVFNERLLNLFAFLVECKMRLSKWEDQAGNVHILDAKPGHIKKSVDACQAILDEVKAKHQMLDASVKQGRELLSQCAGDDNQQAHEKLDSLSVEFSLLISRAGGIVGKLSALAPDSEELDEVDRELKSWFKESNKIFYDLESKDELDLEKWKKLAECFKLGEHEAQLEKVKATSANLSSVSLWWGPQLLGKLHKLHKTQFSIVRAKYDAFSRSFAEILEEMQSFDEELKIGHQLVDEFNESIDAFQNIPSLDKETLQQKSTQEKEMQDLRSQVAAQSVKLEQNFHKLVSRVDRSDARPLVASMDEYRSKMQNALEKHEKCTKTSVLALSLAGKWHKSSDSLDSWMQEAENELSDLRNEKCGKLEAFRQKLQALKHRHDEMRPAAETVAKLSAEISSLLDSAPITRPIAEASRVKRDEYLKFAQKLEDLIKEVEADDRSLHELLQILDKQLKYATGLKEQLTGLSPVSLDEESILQRALVFEKTFCSGGEFDQNLPSQIAEAQKLQEQLGSLGYDHLQEAVGDKLSTLEELKSSLREYSSDQLEKLKALLDSVRRFGDKSEETSAKLSSVSDAVRSLAVHHVINPDILTQQTSEFEALTDELLETGDQVTCLASLGETCKNSEIASGSEPSSVERKTNEAESELARVQALFERKKLDFDSALEYAVHFNKASGDLKRSMHDQCLKIDRLPDNLTDVDEIKRQMELLKAIRGESTPLQVEGKNLCAQAFDLIARSGVAQESQQDEVAQLQNASKLLDDKLQEKQIALDQSLIEAGALQHAADELKDWMDETAVKLADQRGSLDSLENDADKLDLEFTKLKVTAQDIAAHEPTFASVAKVSRNSDELEQKWKEINDAAEDLKRALEKALETAHGKEAQLYEIDAWIDDQLNFLNNSTFFGGLPETAQQQLDNHVAFMDELENKKNALDEILKGPNIEGTKLCAKMETLSSLADTRKAKLENALAEAKAFHESLEKFVGWLGQAEKTLVGFLESNHTVLYPGIKDVLDEQKAFEENVALMRPEILELDKNGSRLKYFSQKQDGILIKNLLLSVHARWEKLLAGTSSRSGAIADVYKKSKQFHDDYDKLRDWISSVSKQLDSDRKDCYVDSPDSVENELKNFKEFQRALTSKQPVYDAVQRAGLVLCEKVHRASDRHETENRLRQLKKEWNAVNQQSVKRKRQLEESLLVSGRFTEAIDSLMQWLCKIEPEVEWNHHLLGDIHTVTALIDRHNILQNEFNARQANVQHLQTSLVGGQGDSWVAHQLKDLLQRWNAVSEQIGTKRDRLDDALLKAKNLHSSAQVLLDELSAAEKHLQSQPKFPDDEFQLEELRASHQTVAQNLESTLSRFGDLNELSQEILSDCHPDAQTPLRQLTTVTETKCAEVKQLCAKHGASLDDAIRDLKRDLGRLENLKAWLGDGEERLRQREAVPVNEGNIESLKSDHEAFSEQMISHQADYESLMNRYKRKHTPVKKKADLRKNHRDPDGNAVENLCDNVHSTWQRVWLMSLQHERKLKEAEDNIRRSGQKDEFDFDAWRKRYMKWMKHKRARVMDFFRELDKDGSGQITRQQFIDEILKSKFKTDEAEMSRVADHFDKDGDGYIDYYEFIAALYPSRDAYKHENDADKIDDEVIRQVAKCTCCKKFKVEQIAQNQYKFGDNQQLRLVRILRSTVMVRVGGGWMALDEFLIKNDPCRAKGRTNTELREKFILPAGSSQAMTPFKTKRVSKSPQKAFNSTTSSVASDESSATNESSSRDHGRLSHTTPAKSRSSPTSRNSTPLPPSKRQETTPKRTSTPTRPKSRGETPKRVSKIPTKDKTPKT